MPEQLDWRPEFRPGVPDINPYGLLLGRAMVTTRTPEEDDGHELDSDESALTWTLHIGVTPDTPRLALVACRAC